jgi:hypothetical protein
VIGHRNGRAAGQRADQLRHRHGVLHLVPFLKGGATLGKMAVGIKVVRSNGERLTKGRAFGRYWAMLLSSFTLGIGFLMAAFTERKQGLHDMICDTLVVDRWAFTDQPHLQRRELGTVTIVILVLTGCWWAWRAAGRRGRLAAKMAS